MKSLRSALGAWSLSHRIGREVPHHYIFYIFPEKKNGALIQTLIVLALQ